VSFQAVIVERSKNYFSADASYPAAWEPGGEDFFSPALIEADLMLRVLKPLEFRRWFRRFCPVSSADSRRRCLLLRPLRIEATQRLFTWMV